MLFMNSARFIGHRWLKPVAIALAFVGVVWYLLSGITVTPPEKDEAVCRDDGYWAMIENERDCTL